MCMSAIKFVTGMVDADAHKKAQESLDSVLAGARRQLVEEHTEVD